MCGRIRQAKSLSEYQETLRWNPRAIFDLGEGLRHNVPPGTRPIALHRLDDGANQADRLHWGYKRRGAPKQYSNARLDTVLKGSGFWRPLLGQRIIVPADGWYEWTGEKGDKQPWFISAKDSAPALLAGITAWQPARDADAEAGFAIITDDAAGGMVDIHDRRPIALTPDDARAWLDPALPVPDALELLSTPRPESAFRWWQVTRAMGNSRYQRADAAEPI